MTAGRNVHATPDEPFRVVIPPHLEHSIRARYRRRVVVAVAAAVAASFAAWVVVEATFQGGAGSIVAALVLGSVFVALRRRALAQQLAEILPYVEPLRGESEELGE